MALFLSKGIRRLKVDGSYGGTPVARNSWRNGQRTRHMSTKISTIDSNYAQISQYAAVYLVQNGNDVAFVDNNTTKCIPILLNALKEHDLSPDRVKYIIVTHIHLDHAGGTSALLSHCKNATVLAHPRAVPHLIEPSKLIAGTKAVYGEEMFEKIYGTILPLPKERIVAVEDGQSFSMANTAFKFIHTRGHAKHHFVIHEKQSNSLFSGDAFGISQLPTLRKYRKSHQDDDITDNTRDFLFPSSSPVDFEAEEAHKSIDKIVDTGTDRVYVTHFGVWHQVQLGAQQMHYAIEVYKKIQDDMRTSLKRGQDEKEIYKQGHKQMKEFFRVEMEKRDIDCKEDSKIWEYLKHEIHLNVDGLVIAAKRSLKGQ